MILIHANPLNSKVLSKKYNICKFILLSSLLLLPSSFAWAGGCNLKDVSNAKKTAARYLAGHLWKRANQIDSETGGDNQVFIIARMGQNMKDFGLLKDDDRLPLQQSLNHLFRQVVDNDWRKPEKAMVLKNKSLKYSHMAFLLKTNPNSKILGQDGTPERKYPWEMVRHLLSNCDKGTDRYGDSFIKEEELDRFFWDTEIFDDDALINKDVKIIVPSKEVQARLFQAFEEDTFQQMHEPKYNSVATIFKLSKPGVHSNPFPDPPKGEAFYQLDKQNSNQWPLEMLAQAMLPEGVVTGRRDAQQVLRHPQDPQLDCANLYLDEESYEACMYRNQIATNYRPTIVTPRGIRNYQACSLSDGLFGQGWIWDASNLVDCEDQVFRGRKIAHLITVDSVARWMKKNDLLLQQEGFDPVQEYNDVDPKKLLLAVKFGESLEDIFELKKKEEEKFEEKNKKKKKRSKKNN